MAIFSALKANFARVGDTHVAHHISTDIEDAESFCGKISANAFLVSLNNILWRLSRQDLFSLMMVDWDVCPHF